MRILILLPAVFLFFQCPAQTPSRAIALDEHHVVVLADSALAAGTIIQDPTDHFFERVTEVEMSIQMKKKLDPSTPRSEMVKAYRAFLQSDVEGFSAKEADQLEHLFRQIFEQCMSVNSRIFPDTLVLIKTKARHYGEGVYYTRGNMIVIPQEAMAAVEESGFRSTMYHEVFHVYSRLNPEKRAALYNLIGFFDIGYDQLQLPATLAARILHNPDGVDFAQKIELTQPDGSIIHAIPVIYANHSGYTDDKPNFFGYLEFQLFQVEEQSDGNWKVLTRPDGLRSTLDLSRQPDFFRQIGDNTTYIIHPDEVLADNFSFIMAAKENGSMPRKFSEEGLQLLSNIEMILQN